MATVLSALSPARRRMVLALLALVLVGILAVTVAVVVTRDQAVEPVAQDRPGSVLLVPGYGGSTGSLDVLAEALTATGRDVVVVVPPEEGTQDLEDQAANLARAVDDALDRSGAPSVDLVGYSAGGVAVRLYVADLGGGSRVRRAVTLASPHHGTDLAALAGALGDRACPLACQQLDPDSDLLRRLNAGDETPEGPLWVAVWTEDDATVVPPESGSLDGATLALSLQDWCPGLVVDHADVPREPAVVALVTAALGRGAPELPDARNC